MSFDALAWAAKQRPGNSSAKLVLLAMAENTRRHEELAFASIAALCEFGDLNRKTVISAITFLEAAGFITDTGQRTGQTKQIKIYKMNLERVPETVPSQKRNSSEKALGTVPKTGHGLSKDQGDKKATLSHPRRASKPKAIGFDLWWTAYPRKVGKGEAQKAYLIACRVIPPDKLLAATVAYAESRIDEDPQFTPHPATWLRRGSYDDPIEEQPIGYAPRNGNANTLRPGGEPRLSPGVAGGFLALDIVRREREAEAAFGY